MPPCTEEYIHIQCCLVGQIKNEGYLDRPLDAMVNCLYVFPESLFWFCCVINESKSPVHNTKNMLK